MQTDLPVTRLADDKLGRKNLATEIAIGLVHSFQNNTESIVIGINGAWGSGKSSFVNFIIEEIETHSRAIGKEIIVLRFNPWMFTGQKELQEIFLHEMLIKLNRHTHLVKVVSEKLGEIIGYFKWIKYIHEGAGSFVQDTAELLKERKKEKSLLELKEELDKVLIESSIKIYVTIDDIDRLTPPEVKEIFQLVKLNGNFANTIFILAYDQDVVNTAMDLEFGKNGKRYIEKIVQVDYSLPKVTRGQILDMLSTCINSISVDAEQVRAIRLAIPNLSSQIFTELFLSPRDVYRFTNAIKIRLKSIFNQLNIRDFFIIEALRLFRPDAYTFAHQTKNRLLGSRESTTAAIMSGRVANSPSAIIDDTTFDETTKILLKALFETFNTSQLTQADELIKERRIASPHYFDRYFNLQLSDSDINEQLYTDFLTNTDEGKRHEILNEVYLKDQLWTFTNFLKSKIDAEGTELAEIIRVTLNFSNIVPYFIEHLNFAAPLLTIKRFCSSLMHRISDIQVNQTLVLSHIKQPANTVSFANLALAYSILDAHKLHVERKLQYDYIWYPLFEGNDTSISPFILEVTFELTSGLKAKFSSAYFNLRSLSDHEIIFLLDETLNHEETFFNQQFPGIINNDLNLARIILVIIGSSWRTVNGKTSYRLWSQNLYPGMDPVEINRRFESIDITSLTTDENHAVRFYKNAFIYGLQKDRWFDYETITVLS
jgi:hypothetical protein